MKKVSISVLDFAGLRAVSQGAINDAQLAKKLAPAFAKRAVRVLALKGLLNVTESAPVEQVVKSTKNTVVTRKVTTKTYSLTSAGKTALNEAENIINPK